MDYRFAPERDYADFAPGRALRGGKGRPNFPVRLALELYGRGAADLCDRLMAIAAGQLSEEELPFLQPLANLVERRTTLADIAEEQLGR